MLDQNTCKLYTVLFMVYLFSNISNNPYYLYKF